MNASWVNDVLREELGLLKDRISENMAAAGQVATGKTQQSMEVSITESEGVVEGVLLGRKYFGALETGSAPWKTQYFRRTQSGKKIPSAPGAFVEVIRSWIAAKGLSLNPYLVATKIMAEGSKLYRDGGRSDIFTNAINDTIEAVMQRIVAAGLDAAMVEVEKPLNREINE